jgi:hypothetical protein
VTRNFAALIRDLRYGLTLIGATAQEEQSKDGGLLLSTNVKQSSEAWPPVGTNSAAARR